jgi:hypothetical protein
LGVLKKYLMGRRRHAQAQKQGGGRPIVSIDRQLKRGGEPTGNCQKPDVEYTRAWANTMIAGVITGLREEAGRTKRGAPIEPLLARLIEGKAATYDAWPPNSA